MASSHDPDLPKTVLQGGRRKAYRPLPAEARQAAFDAFLVAYARGDFFLAHELLEPAWMGTADLPERALHQGLIKVAAAHVHRERGNALGMMKNLRGARDHLASAVDGSADPHGLDLPGLIAAVDDRLRSLESLGDRPVAEIPVVPLAGDAGWVPSHRQGL